MVPVAFHHLKKRYSVFSSVKICNYIRVVFSCELKSIKTCTTC